MKYIVNSLLAVFLMFPVTAFTAETLSTFSGSLEKGRFETELAEFCFAKPGDTASGTEIETIKGSILSRVLVKPQDKSNLEVFRSYESALKNAGFTVQYSANPSGNQTKHLIKQLYGGPPDDRASRLYCSPLNDLSARQYVNTKGKVSANDLARIAAFGEYYLHAFRQTEEAAFHAVLVLSGEKNLYLIDEVKIKVLETGTARLDLDTMRSEITENGKVAVYDIFFASGSADIEVTSADALSVIAEFLNESSDRYYIVGHTDDTGPLDYNLKLSADRARAVVGVLVTDHGIAAERLESRGAGPLAPVSNNTCESGRALNRRVEIVQRLDSDQ